MSKKRKILTMCIMLGLISMTSLTSFAKPLKFDIRRDDGAVIITDNTKDLSGDQWKVSNFDTEYSNFIEDKDVIGFRVRDQIVGNTYSYYHTFSRFVYRYPLTYYEVPAMGQKLRMKSQIDSAGDYSYIKFEGEWIS